MAAERAGTAAQGESSGTTALTFALTVPSGATGVGVTVSSYQRNPTSVTWNGAPLSSEGAATPSSANDHCSIWTLDAPTPATGNVVVNFASSTEVVAEASAYSGQDTSTPWGTFVSRTSNTLPSTPSVDASSAADGLVIDVVATFNPTGFTVGASQTQNYAQDNGSSFISGAGSREVGAATVTMSWSAVDREHVQAALPLVPAAGGGGSTVPVKMHNYRRFRQ